jgi:hypothetical protein
MLRLSPVGSKVGIVEETLPNGLIGFLHVPPNFVDLVMLFLLIPKVMPLRRSQIPTYLLGDDEIFSPKGPKIS